jgi:hypothetical protein
MLRKYFIPTITLGLLLLSGCQSTPVKDINSPYYAPPVGSILHLHTPIELQQNAINVNIQYGRILTSYSQLDTYYPNCDFELRDKVSAPTTIQPERFKIIRVIQDTEVVLLAPVQVASSGGGSPPHMVYQTIMYLQSAKQPNVYRMTCKHWEDPADAEHLSIVKIRKALGKVFTLELAEE